MRSKVPLLVLRTSLTVSRNAPLCRTLATACNIATPSLMSQHRYNKVEIEKNHYCTTAQDTSDAKEDSSSEWAGTVEDIKSAVLDAALEHVHQFGWSKEAIAKGAESLGYSPMSHGIVESGGAQLFVHLQKRCNEELEETLEEWHNSQAPPKWTVAVEKALSRRLLMVAPYRSVWAQGLATVTLSPSLIAVSLQNSLSMADSVCYYAGDRSTQAEWYYRRAAVLAMYKASELSLLQDTSPEFEETLEFLHRRVHQVESLGCSLGSADGAAAEGVKVASAVATTIGNILGLRNTSRK